MKRNLFFFVCADLKNILRKLNKDSEQIISIKLIGETTMEFHWRSNTDTGWYTVDFVMYELAQGGNAILGKSVCEILEA